MNTKLSGRMVASRSRASVRGLSLIELMVALAVSAILMLGLVQVFSAQHMTFNANQALARTQENSRFALDFLKSDLRMGSHMGCLADLGYENSFYNHLATARPASAPYAYRFDIPVQVYDAVGTVPGATVALGESRAVGAAGDWTPALPVELDIAGEALQGSDVIVARYLSADYAWLYGEGINQADNSLTIDPAYLTFAENNGIYALTNCSQISLFQVTGGAGTATLSTANGDNAHDWTGTSIDSLGRLASATKGAENYGRAMMFRYHLVAYYVANGADGRPALFRRELDPAADGRIGAAQEVAPGVESLQIVLGVINTPSPSPTTAPNVRIGDQPTVYMSAAAVQDGTWRGVTPANAPEIRWRDVVSLRMGMLMASSGPASGQTADGGKVVADTRFTLPNDLRQRQVYETYINIRNRSRG